MDKERFEELINKFHLQQLNSAEKAEFEYLLASFDEARKTFHEWNFIYQASKAISISKNIPDISVSKPKVTLEAMRRWLINTAAIITIPLILGLTYLVIERSRDTTTYSEVTAANAKVVNITLPDGSKVSLYAGSTLKYPDHFAKDERLIKLEGEATFDVKSNLKNPFYVETTDGTRVKAYGTKFSVRNYTKDNIISVYLERGIVDFDSPLLNHAVTMKPDTKLLFDKTDKKYSILNSTPNEYDAYEKGILLFVNKPLTEIVQKLNNVYQTEIIIHDESLKDYNFTATIKDESIYQVLNMLSLSSPQLQWEEKGQKIILTKKRLKTK